MCQGLNSHYFLIIGDGHQPNSMGLYTHYRIPIKGGMTIPNIATFDHGTHGFCYNCHVFVGGFATWNWMDHQEKGRFPLERKVNMKMIQVGYTKLWKMVS